MKNQEYSEAQYWNGEVPDELFDDYLKEYGYEYTPLDAGKDIIIESDEVLYK